MPSPPAPLTPLTPYPFPAASLVICAARSTAGADLLHQYVDSNAVFRLVTDLRFEDPRVPSPRLMIIKVSEKGTGSLVWNRHRFFWRIRSGSVESARRGWRSCTPTRCFKEPGIQFLRGRQGHLCSKGSFVYVVLGHETHGQPEALVVHPVVYPQNEAVVSRNLVTCRTVVLLNVAHIGQLRR